MKKFGDAPRHGGAGEVADIVGEHIPVGASELWARGSRRDDEPRIVRLDDEQRACEPPRKKVRVNGPGEIQSASEESSVEPTHSSAA